MKKRKPESLIKQLKKGLRLKTKAPKVETPQNVYRRRSKHRRDDDPSFFYHRRMSGGEK